MPTVVLNLPVEFSTHALKRLQHRFGLDATQAAEALRAAVPVDSAGVLLSGGPVTRGTLCRASGAIVFLLRPRVAGGLECFDVWKVDS